MTDDIAPIEISAVSAVAWYERRDDGRNRRRQK